MARSGANAQFSKQAFAQQKGSIIFASFFYEKCTHAFGEDISGQMKLAFATESFLACLRGTGGDADDRAK
ncbi:MULTISPECIES: hypothetical protein [Pseudophaeobacter]|uniref:hypothetical protein n=1 Tax=Pseudophaeobacter TaxID=1541822 RepID=UPI00242A4C5A|nr:hypothetical protein [Pseudophaeobacter profundi]